MGILLLVVLKNAPHSRPSKGETDDRQVQVSNAPRPVLPLMALVLLMLEQLEPCGGGRQVGRVQRQVEIVGVPSSAQLWILYAVQAKAGRRRWPRETGCRWLPPDVASRQVDGRSASWPRSSAAASLGRFGFGALG
ncbi:MAG: hypothetical protein U0793_34225 [Gemmataceae bacterium]